MSEHEMQLLAAKSIVECMRWFYNEKDATFEEIEDFMKSITVQEPDPAVIRELYERYRQAVDATGLRLEEKFNAREKD